MLDDNLKYLQLTMKIELQLSLQWTRKTELNVRWIWSGEEGLLRLNVSQENCHSKNRLGLFMN